MGLSRPADWKSLYKAYCMEKTYLYNTDKITFLTSKSGQGVTGSRLFKQQYLEIFRYWNNDVSFAEKKMINGTVGVEVTKKDGTVHFIEGRGRTKEDIYVEVMEKAEGVKVPVNIPI
eukprot:gene2668-3083_t